MRRRFRLRDEDTPLSLGLSFDKKDFDKVKKALKDFESNALAEIIEPNRFGIQHVWIDCTGLGSDEMKEARRFIERLKKLISPKARENDSCVKGISSKHVHKAHDSEDLGWISTPELLEEDDFVDTEAFEFWVETLGEIAHAQTGTEMKRLARDAMTHLHDGHFRNPFLVNEIRDDLNRVINRPINDTDWDFIHQIKKFHYDDIETAMVRLFHKKFINENFADEWGDPDLSAMRLATFLDKPQKDKLLKYLREKASQVIDNPFELEELLQRAIIKKGRYYTFDEALLQKYKQGEFKWLSGNTEGRSGIVEYRGMEFYYNLNPTTGELSIEESKKW